MTNQHEVSSTEEPLTIGRDDHTYEVDHNWANLPSGKGLRYTHGIVEDRQGRIYITNQSPDAVAVFGPDGQFMTSWGAAYQDGAHGLLIHNESGEEVLYLANTSLAEVVKTSLEGEVIWKAGVPPVPSVYGDGQPYSPTETAVAPDGTVYVADGYGQSWIHVYSNEGQYLDSFGGPGTEEHHLDQPHGISMDLRGDEAALQVADRAHVRIVNYSLEGDFLGVVIPPSELRFPCTTFHAHGLLYIPDLYARVSIFDADNRKILDLGDYVEGGELNAGDDVAARYPDLAGYPNIRKDRRFAGKFIAPHALWVNSAGDIFVVEWIDEGRVTKLARRS